MQMITFRNHDQADNFFLQRRHASEAFLLQTQSDWYRLLNVRDEVQVMISKPAFKKCTGLTIDFNHESLPGLYHQTKYPNYLIFHLSRIGDDLHLRKLRDALTDVVCGGFLDIGKMGSIFCIRPIFGGRSGSRKDVFCSLNNQNPLTKSECTFFEIVMQWER